MSEIRQLGEHSYAAHLDDGRVYTLSNGRGDDFAMAVYCYSQEDWDYFPQQAGGALVVPWGPANSLPTTLRDILGANNLAPGVLDRQRGLIFGQGLHLYRTRFTNGEIVREWINDPEVEDWLGSWDASSFAREALTEYLHLNGYFWSISREKGFRIGRKARIACLKVIPSSHARLEWPESRNPEDIHHIIVGDYEHQCLGGIRKYPVFDPSDPVKYAVSAGYSRTRSFGRRYYSVPQYWGTLRWIIRGSEIPTIFKYVTDNGLNLAYHIHSPQAYWDNKRETLRNIHPDWDDAKVEKAIGELTQKFLTNLTDVLSGKENAGKFFHTVDFIDDTGKPATWSIDPIDQKIKDFVESQLKIAEASSSAITSGMGLHPALSNLIINGKLASGSELLYAYKLFLSSDTDIPESIVLGPLNTAISFNFPGKGVKAGFYHRTVHTEEATSTSSRMKNQ